MPTDFEEECARMLRYEEKLRDEWFKPLMSETQDLNMVWALLARVVIQVSQNFDNPKEAIETFANGIQERVDAD